MEACQMAAGVTISMTTQYSPPPPNTHMHARAHTYTHTHAHTDCSNYLQWIVYVARLSVVLCALCLYFHSHVLLHTLAWDGYDFSDGTNAWRDIDKPTEILETVCRRHSLSPPVYHGDASCTVADQVYELFGEGEYCPLRECSLLAKLLVFFYSH